MIRQDAAASLSAYVPKKDLEEAMVAQDKPKLGGD
jgi:probable nitrogen fixation protein FixT